MSSSLAVFTGTVTERIVTATDVTFRLRFATTDGATTVQTATRVVQPDPQFAVVVQIPPDEGKTISCSLGTNQSVVVTNTFGFPITFAVETSRYVAAADRIRSVGIRMIIVDTELSITYDVDVEWSQTPFISSASATCTLDEPLSLPAGPAGVSSSSAVTFIGTVAQRLVFETFIAFTFAFRTQSGASSVETLTGVVQPDPSLGLTVGIPPGEGKRISISSNPFVSVFVIDQPFLQVRSTNFRYCVYARRLANTPDNVTITMLDRQENIRYDMIVAWTSNPSVVSISSVCGLLTNIQI